MFYLPCDNSSICFEEVWQPTNLDLASHSPWKHLSQVLQLMLNLVMAMLKVKNLIQFVEKITIFAKSILSKERIKVIIYTRANLHSAPGTFSFLHLVPWHSSSALRFCINYSLLLNCLVFSNCSSCLQFCMFYPFFHLPTMCIVCTLGALGVVATLWSSGLEQPLDYS